MIELILNTPISYRFVFAIFIEVNAVVVDEISDKAYKIKQSFNVLFIGGRKVQLLET